MIGTLMPCIHHEVDNRMLLHLKNASENRHQQAMIKTVNTDVVILAIFTFNDLAHSSLVAKMMNPQWSFLQTSWTKGEFMSIIGSWTHEFFINVSFVVQEYSWTVHENFGERSWTFMVFCSRILKNYSWMFMNSSWTFLNVHHLMKFISPGWDHKDFILAVTDPTRSVYHMINNYV